MNKLYIFNYTLEELAKSLKEHFPAFRAKQIYHWLYVHYESHFENMVNLPKDLREFLAQNYTSTSTALLKKEESKDGSIKYLFKTYDNHSYESVLIRMKEDKFTLCLSSQIGCKVGCSFCLTAKGGFVRNLEAGEMVYQVLLSKKTKTFHPTRLLILFIWVWGNL